MGMAQPEASVVVATRDRPSLLRECLESLYADNSAASREVIVVDNGSSEETAELVSTFQRRTQLDVRCVREQQIGLSHAKNRGVAEANGPLIIFLDDDMAVENGWVDALLGPLADPQVVAVTGRVLPRWLATPPDWMWGPHARMLTSKDFGDRNRRLAPDEFPLGGNSAMRAELLRAFAPAFDPTLGHRGALVIGGEDVGVAHRLREYGHLVYAATAVAHHAIPAERATWGWVRRRHFQGGFGEARVASYQGYKDGASLPRRMARAGRLWWRAHALRRRNRRFESPTADEAWQEFLAYMWAGRGVALVVHRFPRVADWLAARLV